MAGRPTKYNEQTVNIFIEAIKAGATNRLACEYAGISEDTLARWRKLHSDFAERIARTRAQRAIISLARIHDAGKKGNVNADMWYLERMHPDDYGAKLIMKLDPEHVALLKKHGLTPMQAMEQLINALDENDASAR